MKTLFATVLCIVWSLTGCPAHGQSVFFNYTAPLHGSEYINPEQSLILKTGIPLDQELIDDSKILITGSESGNHTFSWKLSEDFKTLVVTPDFYFGYGETITVNVADGIKTLDGSEVSGINFSFRIKTQDNLPFLKEFYKRAFNKESLFGNDQPEMKPSSILRRDNNLPDNYPAPEMINYVETDDNYLFFTINPRAGAPVYKNYLSINDKFGVPIFFRKTQNNCLNFHMMPNGSLAYARNDYANPENEKYFFMDSSYVVVDSVKTGNGYNMDGHDILLMENGHYLLMSYDPQPVDMSLVVLGGNPNAIVVGLILQEVDHNETVYFQWRSWDHFQITDATNDINLWGSYIDYVHGNAFEFDMDGNLLLSSRHLDEITKINYQTGNVIYRFGLLSKNNQFTINNDPNGFSHQHDVRVLSNGNITLYDNGNLHPYQFSQALEYSIDELTMTADLVWFYQHNPDVYGPATGSYRRAADGKNLIGWGATWPLAATEFMPDQTITFEVYLPDGVTSYRVIKDAWNTNLFTAPPQLHFGNYEGYTGPKYMILPVYNNSEHQIRITSSYNQTDLFDMIDDLPLIIPAGETIEVTVSFLPTAYGSFNDQITLNYDKFSIEGTERISRQVKLNGIWDNSMTVVTFLPEFGTIDVDPESNITVLFSEPIRKFGGYFINNNDIPDLFSFKISNQWGDDIPFTGIISDDRQLISLTPVETLADDQQYFVQLIPFMIENDDGDVFSYPETTVFTTGTKVSIEPKALSSVIIFPSPFDNRLVVVSGDHHIGQLCIYNGSGLALINEHSDNSQLEINTEHFPEGIYLVKVTDHSGEVVVIKVVKTR
ncbi:MAG: aryl-sulfate sulfotransferase [Bacteroidales bacterium]|nr:aryl-sulfate sulfotransferase [Bacteroidales bacterium]